MRKWGKQKQQETLTTDNDIPIQNKKAFKNSGVTSEYVLREINLFIPEVIGIVVALLLGIGTVFFMRILGLTQLESIKPMLGEQGYTEAAMLISNVNSIALVGIAIPILIMLAFFLMRFTMFQPKRDRFLTARFLKTGGIRLSIEKFKDEIPFTRDPMSDKVKIVDPKAHFEEKTGKPFIVMFEGDDRNANLRTYGSGVTTKGRDSNTINDMAVDFGRRLERYLSEGKDNFFTATNIILIILLIGMAFIAFMVLKNPETTAGLLAPAGLMWLP